MKSWLSQQVLTHPKRLIIVNVLFTILFAYGLKWLVIDDNFMNMLPKDIESRRVWEEVEAEFGASEMMFIAFGHSGKSIYHKESFKSVWDLTELIENSPYVDEVISISTMNRMDSEDGFMEIDDLQPNRNLSTEAIQNIKIYLDNNPDMKARVIGKSGDFMSMVVRPKDGNEVVLFTNSVLAITDSLLTDYEVHYAGNSYITGVVPEIVQNDVSKLMGIGIIIMVIMLLANLRNVSAVAMVMLIIIMSMVSMLGSMGWIFYLTGIEYFHFSMMNTSMPIILLTIANSDSVHFITRFFREVRKKKDVNEAVTKSLNALFLPIFLTSLTTAVAFMTLISSPIKHMMGYGIAIAFGILWAWILSLTILPSLIVLKKWNLNSAALSQSSYLERWIEKLGQKNLMVPKRVLTFGALLVFIVSFGLWKVNVEVNVIKFFKPGNPIRESSEFIDRELTGSMSLLFKTTGDMKDPHVLNDMLLIQKKAESFPQSNTSISIADVIKSMHKVVMDDDPKYETIPETRGKVNNLFTMYSMSGDPDDFNSLVDYNYETGLITSLLNSISTNESVEMVTELESFIEDEVTSDLEIKISGMVVFLRDFVDLVVRSSFISIGLSIIIIFIIAWIFFGSVRWGLLSVIPLVSAIILNFGLMGHFEVHLSHMTALLTSIIIGVGVDFAIHYIAEFRRNSRRGYSIDEVSIKTTEDVGYPILLDVASNMGFAALLFSALIPLNYMGGLMVFAMISTSLGTLTLLATIVEIFKKHLYNK
ncbi:MAG: MMPL family transporter [Candidatus Marinimicrobia bacterium]|nr:MMPL family transporter [Candidatus Neomarinimicrobiota bacterium]